jgi:hypothetical protein
MQLARWLGVEYSDAAVPTSGDGQEAALAGSGRLALVSLSLRFTLLSAGYLFPGKGRP